MTDLELVKALRESADRLEEINRSVPVTNGDRFRALSDFELAKVIMCACPRSSGEVCAVKTDCITCCMNWLKSPVESGVTE